MLLETISSNNTGDGLSRQGKMNIKVNAHAW